MYVEGTISQLKSIFVFRLTSALQSKPTVNIVSDDTELDHRLHLHVVTEHFTHDNERIQFHFRVKSSILLFSLTSLLCSVFSRSFNIE